MAGAQSYRETTLRPFLLVVVSDDEVTERGGVPVAFNRKGYVGIFEIADFKKEPNGTGRFDTCGVRPTRNDPPSAVDVLPRLGGVFAQKDVGLD